MPAKLDRCVKRVKKESPGVNAWAVCQKALYGDKKKSSSKKKRK